MKKLNFLICVIMFCGLVACSSNSPQEDDLMQDANTVEMAQDDSDALEIAEDDLQTGEGEEIVEQAVEGGTENVPVQEVAPVATQDVEYYEVQSGDTLMLIAFKIYGDYMKWKEIARMNEETLGSHLTLTKGTRIKYAAPASRFEWNPAGDPYLIVRGDTLGKISNKLYSTEKHWKDLWDNNRPMIKDPSLIFAGFTLYYLPLRDLASR